MAARPVGAQFSKSDESTSVLGIFKVKETVVSSHRSPFEMMGSCDAERLVFAIEVVKLEVSWYREKRLGCYVRGWCRNDDLGLRPFS